MSWSFGLYIEQINIVMTTATPKTKKAKYQNLNPNFFMIQKTCGLCFVFRFTGEIDAEPLENTLIHRGKDNGGVYLAAAEL